MTTQEREGREFRLALSSWQHREQAALQYRSQASTISTALMTPQSHGPVNFVHRMTEEQRLHNMQAQNEMYAAMERGER